MMVQLAPLLKPGQVLIHGTKGLDVGWPQDTLPDKLPQLTRAHVKTMSEVMQEVSHVQHIGCVAGPNLAAELAQKQPAAAVIASPIPAVRQIGEKLLRSDRFQVYSNKDLLGAELCGVLKNIMAICAGCLSGLGYGENARALLISRGMVEMIHIGRAIGASIHPFLGLAGLGDLVATCTSKLSRNHAIGYRLAQGETLEQMMQHEEETAEGVRTVKIIRSLIDHYSMRAPITEMMYRVLFEGLTVQEAVQYLMKAPINVDVDFL